MAKADNDTMVTVRFEGDDLQTLDALVEFERLTRSDVIRRAVRAYGIQLGVAAPPKPPKRRR